MHHPHRPWLSLGSLVCHEAEPNGFKTGIYFDIWKGQSSRRAPLLLWAESSYPRASHLTPVPISLYPAQSPEAKGDRNLAVSCGEGRGELGQLASCVHCLRTAVSQKYLPLLNYPGNFSPCQKDCSQLLKIIFEHEIVEDGARIWCLPINKTKQFPDHCLGEAPACLSNGEGPPCKTWRHTVALSLQILTQDSTRGLA